MDAVIVHCLHPDIDRDEVPNGDTKFLMTLSSAKQLWQPIAPAPMSYLNLTVFQATSLIIASI